MDQASLTAVLNQAKPGDKLLISRSTSTPGEVKHETYVVEKLQRDDEGRVMRVDFEDGSHVDFLALPGEGREPHWNWRLICDVHGVGIVDPDAIADTKPGCSGRSMVSSPKP